MFEKLNALLEKEEWPNVYFFKFIVPNNPEKVAKVHALFGEDSKIDEMPSKNGNYISISAKEMMLDAASVVKIYESAAKIEGLIAL